MNFYHFYTALSQYCADTPPQPNNTYNVAAFNRIVGSNTTYQCLPGYSAGSTGLPAYTCNSFNTTNGIFNFSGSCLCIAMLFL